MKNNETRKLAVAGVLCAVAVVGSLFSFPVFGSKCAPVQHMVNILCAVFLGPWYGVGVAFVASLLRNLLGLGSLMAFPGSMCGALLCGLVYWKTRNLPATLAGEVFGTASSNSSPGTQLLPCGNAFYECGCRGHRVLRLCDPVFDFHDRRVRPGRNFSICPAKDRRAGLYARLTGELMKHG